MKIKELLEKNDLESSLSPNLQSQLFSKINLFIIELLINQGNINISAFIQKLSSLLSEDYQKQLVSNVNFLVMNNSMAKPISQTSLTMDPNLRTQIDSAVSQQVQKSLSEQKFSPEIEKNIAQSIKDNLKDSLLNQTIDDKITEQIRAQIQEQLKNQSSGGSSGRSDGSTALSDDPAKKNVNLMLQSNFAQGDADFAIDESGSALGITIGRTTRMEAITILKKFSSINNSQGMARQLTYDDIGLTIAFNDQKIVKGLTFGKNYKGSTVGGLTLGDSIDKAIKIYGEPQYKTAYNAVWKEMALFCDEPNVISSIRLQV